MFESYYNNINQVILGKRNVAKKLLIALLAEGHVLIEDVPGVGKTTMAKALAYSLESTFSRVQFTPDLLPSDILGVSVYNQKTGIFEFKKGPVFNQILLTDEINRASPKTQSSLLEAMEEKQVTMDGKTYTLEKPFMVIATQNPIEHEGTFALPQAQLDRFLMKISMGYPSEKYERGILKKIKDRRTPEDLKPIFSSKDVLDMRESVNEVHTDESIESYIFKIIRETRNSDEILLGCSTRAAIALFKTSKARAYVEGRTYVIPEDIKSLATDVLGHRILVKPEIKYQGLSNNDVISRIVKRTRVPKEMNADV